MERCLSPRPPLPPASGCCFGVNDQVNPYLRNLQPLKEQLFPTLIQGQSFHPSGKRKKKGKQEGSHLQPLKVKLLPHTLITPQITSWCFGNSRAI